MAKESQKQLFISFLILLLLSACFGRPAPINVKSITTVINEDSSGSNSFHFAEPVRCERLDFRPALNDFKSQVSNSGGKVNVSEFNNEVDAGWDVTVYFESPEQISEQIEGLKRGIVLTVKNNWTGDYPPDWDSLAATNDNEFSVEVSHPVSTDQGKAWQVDITLSPAMLTSPAANCSYPQIDYKIVMPGSVKSHEVKIKAYRALFQSLINRTMSGSFEEQLVKYAPAHKTQKNTLLWEIRPKSVGEIMLEQDGIDLEQLIKTMDSEELEDKVGQLIYDHLNRNKEERAEIEQFLGGPIQNASTAFYLVTVQPIYIITVNSGTSAGFVQFAINNITPMVVLIGSIVGVIFTIINIRQAVLRRKEKT